MSITTFFIPVVSFLLLFGTVISSPSALSAENLYMVKDRGAITFTTRRPTRGKSFKTIKSNHPRFSKIYRRRGAGRRGQSFKVRQSKYDGLIAAKAGEQSLNPALVKAVVHIESAFRPSVRSPKGAVGLMQLMPATAKRFGVIDRHDPAQNLEGGVKYLRWLLNYYKGNVKLAIAAYNAGEGAVDKYGGIPPYRETKNYVQKVIEAFKSYHNLGPK